MPDPDPNVDPNVDSSTVKIDHKIDSPEYKEPDINMAEAIPPEFRDKSYFKDKSFVDIIKEHDNLQTLLGKRPEGIPTNESSDDEWNKFLTSLRPATVEEYELPETDFSKAKGRSDEYIKSAKDILFKANVNKRQASEIITGFEAFLGTAQTAQDKQTTEQAQARETEFEGLLDTTYGSQKQAVIDRTKQLMTDSVDASLKDKVVEVLKDIPNDTLFVLTAVLDGVHKKYIAEDHIIDGDNAAGDIASWQKEAEEIMKSDAYKDFRSSGYDAARQRVPELFQQIANAKKS